MTFQDDKDARRELAELYRKAKTPKHISEAPISLPLGELDRMVKAHERIARQECVNAFIGLLARNRCLTHLPAEKVRKLIEESVGIKS